MGPKLIRGIVVDSVPPGKFEVGGVRIVDGDDETLGRELRTTEVRCHSSEELHRLCAMVEATDGMEMTR